MKHSAIFLDRDGTLNRDLGYVHRVKDLELLPGVVAGLQQMSTLGFQLFITTNQSGIARGYFTESEMHAFNHALVELLAAEDVTIAGIYFCPFHPTEGVGAYRRESPLRKPACGMIAQAAAEHELDLANSFAIGDKKSDILAGQAAGCRTILVKTGAGGRGEAELDARPDFVAADLVAAAQFIRGSSPSFVRSVEPTRVSERIRL
jgi:D-glycero-D-manno-heptose 1,7-bisphosphate phosphatase